jgi:hypothetical protein
MSKIVLTEAEINHLRRVLAWMRCEYMLDEDMQRGFANAAKWMANHDPSQKDAAIRVLNEQAEKIRHVPKYVRQGVKMLTKLLRDSDKLGDVIDVSMRARRLLESAKTPPAEQLKEGR